MADHVHLQNTDRSLEELLSQYPQVGLCRLVQRVRGELKPDSGSASQEPLSPDSRPLLLQSFHCAGTRGIVGAVLQAESVTKGAQAQWPLQFCPRCAVCWLRL